MNLLENELLFAKTKKDAIIPSKRDEDAGMDVYACFDDDYIVILANETKMIPTGIASALSSKYYIQLEERGSTGSKGIKRSCGIIDSGFRSEWFVALSNVNDVSVIISKLSIEELINKYGKLDVSLGDNDILLEFENNRYILLKTNNEVIKDIIIYPYTKAVAQAVVHEVPKMIISEVDYEDLLKIKSERGIGALGSSNK